MKSVRYFAVLVLAGSALGLPGCGEGGAFFNQLETYITREGQSSNDMSTTVRMYGEQQRTAALDLKSQMVTSSRREDESRDVFRGEMHRYFQREREQYPNLTTSSNTIVTASGEQAKREFPTED